MTSTTDTTQHPDVAEISDLTEGLLSPSRTEEVRRHVDDCALCRDVLASLEEIQGMLGALPDAERMPDDIARRIDAALSAEAHLDTPASDEAADVSRETSAAEHGQSAEGPEAEGRDAEGPERASHETRRPEAQPASGGRPTGRPQAATGPGRRSARRRRTIVLGAALGAAAVVTSVLMLQTVRTSHSSDAASKVADMGGASESGANAFSGSSLSLRVHTLLSGSGNPAAEDAPSEKRAPSIDSQSTPDNESSASPRTSLRTPAAAVPACIQQGIGRKTAALAIEKGTYEGLPAFLVVLPHQSDTTLVQAYVIDAGCVEADPTGKGELLLTHTYARP
ncbi:hypothetical protein ABZS81_29370 [Streptomyces sp. NPDC005318]|uniref:anti-sigma factor family protein n=1 Tax=Streptomyces sp. NPDC005318 TaxID=3157031 RepID=UPI0033AE2528